MGAMINYFIFDGVASTTYNTYISQSNMFDASSEDVESIIIPGRNGALHLSNNRFNSFQANIECYIPSGMKDNVDEIKNYLLSKKKSCEYREYLRPGEFRLARFLNSFELENSDRVGALFKLQFECRPERWLDIGQEKIALSANGSIENPTLFEAKPLLRVFGTGNVSIDDISITIRSTDEYTDIDCEIMEAYKESINCNNNIEVNSFPVLAPGINEVVLEGVSKLEVIPRWYEL